MDYKNTVYKECLEVAKELLKENYIKTELPLYIRDHLNSDQIDSAFQESIQDLSDVEIIAMGKDLLKKEIEKDRYKNEMSKKIDEEWVEAMDEWVDIHNEKLVARFK